MKKLRIVLFAALLLGTTGVLIRSVVKAITVPSTAFEFPEQVPLSGASWVNSQPTERPAQESYAQSFDSRHYDYEYQGQPLEVEILYVEGTGGSLERFFENFEALDQSQLPSVSEMREAPGIGFYQLYSDQSYAYLSACIAPVGKSSVTFDQFLQYWASHLYLLGRDYLDDRCLWTHLRLPLQDQTSTQAYADLEVVWQNWHSFWRRRFPGIETLKSLS